MASRAEKKRRRREVEVGNRRPILLGKDVALFDPTESPGDDTWRPSNESSSLLVACLEAVKDIDRSIAGLDREVPLADRRGLTMMVTPLVSLLDNLEKLRALLGREDRSHWNPE